VNTFVSRIRYTFQVFSDFFFEVARKSVEHFFSTSDVESSLISRKLFMLRGSVPCHRGMAWYGTSSGCGRSKQPPDVENNCNFIE
jgi:hypothetical protein